MSVSTVSSPRSGPSRSPSPHPVSSRRPNETVVERSGSGCQRLAPHTLSWDNVHPAPRRSPPSHVLTSGGNFRLLHRLFVQIERILKIDGLSVITDDVVEAARSTLVIGAAVVPR